ncbi:MAG: OmpA family protein [Pseudomonadota bacterium]
MKIKLAAAVAAVALGVAGCSNLPGANLGDTFFIESFLDQELPGGSYTNELALAYQERAAWEAEKDTNWVDATAFYRKGQAAQAGEEVQPWDPAIFGLDGDLATGYARTLDAAAQYKDVRPKACARMVAFYDHWVEEAREGSHSITPVGVMQGEWASARIECIGGLSPIPPAADARWIVYFGFDQSSLTSKAREVVADVVDAVAGTASRLAITGHTDTVGSKAYNQGLSVRRARSVARALAASGVSTADMTLSGRSENELAVETGDGVREPLNRRVVIEKPWL